MRLVIQRVRSAAVRVQVLQEGRKADLPGAPAGQGGQEAVPETVAAIGRGLLVLVGVERGDGPDASRAAAEKLAGLRVFDDEAGKMNLDAAAVGGAFLVVSQFTLAGSVERGRRPSFDRAAPPAEAAPLVALLAAELRRRGCSVAEGRFRTQMEVELINDGPVTLLAQF